MAHSPSLSTTTAYLDSKISLDNFRTLLGLPTERTPLPSTRLPRWWPESIRHRPQPDTEANVGVYPNILAQEHVTTRSHTLHTLLSTSTLFLQLLLSFLLILLASLPSDHHVAIAVFGAITGVLALLRGRGPPNQLLQYRDGLRALREKIEWLEKELEAGLREVRYREVVELRDNYEALRGEENGE
ncbi:hypothetical protein EJ04DRAFT_514781 [Polyplosphaeria fusca]|uniref:SMODS and SLOG-associating 2TM effector domain-containing protein n=1 Tax=Polyplosphaeria fusca TaxID=682080 RepID=A0A9P4QPC1_9PLEO|nr:hypothetical protein EJ04DRAFT_514781 [Polyplosphaeria fusca]